MGIAEATGTTTDSPHPSGRLVNGGFEEPSIPLATNRYLDEIPGWSSVDASMSTQGEQMELWATGFPSDAGKVPSATGNQFLELNAKGPTTVFQDVETKPGEEMVWSLHHRGRLGEDTMLVRIGPPDHDQLQPQNPQGRSGPDIVDGNKAWGHWQGTYVVPEGQTKTRIALTAKSASDPTEGNFVDSVFFGAKASPTVLTKVSDDRAQRGQELLYTTVVDNSVGDSPISDVVFTQSLPPRTEFVPGSLTIDGHPVTEGTDDDTGSVDGEDIRLNLGAGATSSTGGKLEPKKQSTVAYKLRLAKDAPLGTEVRHRSNVSYTTPTGGAQTAMANETDTALATADLSVSGVVTPTPLKAGEPGQYTVTVTNNGPDPAIDVILTSDIPSPFTEASVTMDGASCEKREDQAVCELVLLRAGQTAEMTVKGDVPPNYDPSSGATVKASAASSTADPAPENDSLTLDVSAEASADLSVVMGIDNDKPKAGGTATYTVTVHNAGPSDAREVQVTDELPEEFTLEKATPSDGAFTAKDGVWDLGTLRVGQDAELTLTGVVPANVPEMTHRAQITRSATPDPDSEPGKGKPGDDHLASLTTTVSQVADLDVDKSVNTEEMQVGDDVTFDITVTNQGPSDTTQVHVEDRLPMGLTHLSDDSDGSYDPATGQWTVKSLPAGESRTLKIEARVDAAGTITNQINTVVSGVEDPSPCVWDCARATVQADFGPGESPSPEPTSTVSGTPSAKPSQEPQPDSTGSLASTGSAGVAMTAALAGLAVVGGALTVYALRRRG
ncbi:DUF11 domain-containing protein [Streptomyces spinoverrucosus]|uniref:DUF11 domain-containing protein n=1 Tax=Streptomyces spinoverrucosus TaxID=284043 RepID=UPI00142ECCDA|nr:DUF11 domain-containing protein [Streptomyces spinoverrucosus]